VLFICKTILAPPSFGAATVNPFLGPGLGRKTLNAENHTTWKVGVDVPIGPDWAGFKNDSLCGCCGHGAEYNLGSRRGNAGCCFNLIAKTGPDGRRSRHFGRASAPIMVKPKWTMHGSNGTGMVSSQLSTLKTTVRGHAVQYTAANAIYPHYGLPEFLSFEDFRLTPTP
jgi:hypothetical protein